VLRRSAYIASWIGKIQEIAMIEIRKFAVLVLAAASVACIGCTVEHNKNANGDNVKIAIPMGGLQVNADNTTHPADLGLPEYPGAVAVKDDNSDKEHNNSGSADISMGFAGYNLRIKVVTFGTNDSPEQVMAFYKKALGRYGDVVQCQNGRPVGKPEITPEGLNCSNSGNTKLSSVDMNEGSTLKAGSKHHQRIVAIDANGVDGRKTKFVLLELELPNVPESDKNSD
jgi:hypothetical protein